LDGAAAAPGDAGEAPGPGSGAARAGPCPPAAAPAAPTRRSAANLHKPRRIRGDTFVMEGKRYPRAMS